MTDYEQELQDAILDKAQQEALQAEFAARREEVACNLEEYEYERLLSGVYTLRGEIKPKKVDQMIRHMRTWHDHEANAPWTIYVNSVGGDCISGMGLLDEIRSYSIRGGGTHDISMKVRGQAASMAAILLQVADNRIMGPSSNLMIHEPSGEIGGSWGQLDDEWKWFQAFRTTMVNVFLERTTTWTADEFLAMINRTDAWFSAEQALAAGLCDEIG